MADETNVTENVTVKVVVVADETLDAAYANYAEVSQTQYDTEINFARVPGKLSLEQVEEARQVGELRIEPIVKVVLPKEVAQGLAAAIERNLKGIPDQ